MVFPLIRVFPVNLGTDSSGFIDRVGSSKKDNSGVCCNLSIDSFHIVISLSNRSSIEKSIVLFLKMKGQTAYWLHCKIHSDAL